MALVKEVPSLVDLCTPGGEDNRDHHPKSNARRGYSWLRGGGAEARGGPGGY